MSADGSVKQNGVGDQGRKNCTITGTGGSSESVGLFKVSLRLMHWLHLFRLQFYSATSLPSVHTVFHHCLPLPVQPQKGLVYE